MKLPIAAMLVVLVGARMLCAEEPQPIEDAIDGILRELEPVDIDAAFPVPFRRANPGDHVLLQVAYDPNGATPVAVSVSNSSAALSVVGTLAAAGEGPACCYVVVRADEIGSCVATLTYEMNDGSFRTVPFAYSIITPQEEAARVAADRARNRRYAWTFVARQEGAVVTLTWTGAFGAPNIHPQLKVRPTEGNVPAFDLSIVTTANEVRPAYSPFTRTAGGTLEERVDVVYLYLHGGDTPQHIPVYHVPVPEE